MIQLSDIENAIRANFLLNNSSRTYLSCRPEAREKSTATARIVFVGIAHQYHYSSQEICEFIHMSFKEYQTCMNRYDTASITGKELYERIKTKEINYNGNNTIYDINLRIYRKSLLIEAYLNNISKLKMFERKQSIHNVFNY